MFFEERDGPRPSRFGGSHIGPFPPALLPEEAVAGTVVDIRLVELPQTIHFSLCVWNGGVHPGVIPAVVPQDRSPDRRESLGGGSRTSALTESLWESAL